MTTCYLVNRSSSNALSLKKPIEIWSGKAANYLGLKIFGCAAYAHVKQGKLEPRALKCVFLGYLKGVKGYKLWCTDLKPSRCINSRDVVFNELEMLSKRHATELGDSEEGSDSQGQYLQVEFSGKLNQGYHDSLTNEGWKRLRMSVNHLVDKQKSKTTSLSGIGKEERLKHLRDMYMHT